jgi:hypothetical protein
VPPARLFQALNDEVVGLPGGDQPAFDLGPRGTGEGAVGGHRPSQRQPVLDAGGVIVGAEGRGEVHDP